MKKKINDTMQAMQPRIWAAAAAHRSSDSPTSGSYNGNPTCSAAASDEDGHVRSTEDVLAAAVAAAPFATIIASSSRRSDVRTVSSPAMTDTLRESGIDTARSRAGLQILGDAKAAAGSSAAVSDLGRLRVAIVVIRGNSVDISKLLIESVPTDAVVDSGEGSVEEEETFSDSERSRSRLYPRFSFES